MPADLIARETFDAFRAIVYDRGGIHISDNKDALVAARIGKRMRELGIADHAAYLDLLNNDNTGEEIISLLDVISTNVTSFFREEVHFGIFGSLMEEWYNQGQRKFRFWCAASSTGEEPYTMAMTALDRLNGRDANVKILATDISTRVLAQCEKAVYAGQKTATIPLPLLKRYFTAQESTKGTSFAAGQELRDLVTFSRLNLSKPPFPMSGPFDAVFCRNVMIYFDNTVRKRLLEDIYRLVKDGGYLFVGHAESLTGLLSGFKSVKPSVYVKI